MRVEAYLKKLKEKNGKRIYKESKEKKEDKKIKIIGITGSKGKSSIAYMLYEYLTKIGKRSILYSSIMIMSPYSIRVNKKAVERAIYDDTCLQDAIEEAGIYNAEYIILEINETTIENKVIESLEFDIKVLTNIEPTQNEMVKDYVEIKKAFLKDNSKAKKIMFVGSKETKELQEEIKDKKVITYSSKYLIAKYKLENIDYVLEEINSPKGRHVLDEMAIKIRYKQKTKEYLTNKVSGYYALNIMCLKAIIHQLKEEREEEFEEYIKALKIPGRDEIIKYKERRIIITLFLEPLLESLKQYQKEGKIDRIIVVTGTTGTKFVGWDKYYESKEYLEQHNYDISYAYNYIIENGNKLYITTSDIGNENIQETNKKIKDIIEGKIEYKIIENREEAIKDAIIESEKKDVIVISGRGNKEEMCINNKIILFNDMKKAQAIIESMEKERC